MQKNIAPAAINALKEALTNIYWYRKELRSFIANTISDPSILSRINWDDLKRNIVTLLVDYLAHHQDIYQNDLLKLMSEVCRIKDFSHLSRLEDGPKKAQKAKESVEALRKLLSIHEDILDEQKKIEARRKVAYENSLKNEGIRHNLEDIHKKISTLVCSKDHQNRGYQLEKIILELFNLFDLDPKASFRIAGEQIDGAFTFENCDYLFEGKWQTTPVGIEDLDAFAGKLSRKLKTTLGLFLSINGFSEDAVKAHSTGSRVMILMDGADLMAVIEGRIDLIELLLRKRRHASQTGSIYMRVNEIL